MVAELLAPHSNIVAKGPHGPMDGNIKPMTAEEVTRYRKFGKHCNGFSVV